MAKVEDKADFKKSKRKQSDDSYQALAEFIMHGGNKTNKSTKKKEKTDDTDSN